MTRWNFAPLLCLAFVTASAQLDTVMQQRIDAAVQGSMQRTGAPSVSVAIVKDGRVVYVKAFGLADVASAQAATPATRYQLASVSKTFVAQAVLLLVAEGKLSLEDPVSKWFPQLTRADAVTVRQLLAHTSGYQDHYPQSYPAGPRGGASTPDAIISEWGKHPLMFSPGTQYHYSNLEYEIAGRIVEKVSGQPLFALLQQRILQPVGIVDAIDLDTIPNGSTVLATGYVRQALGPLEAAPYEGPGWSFGSGQIVMTAEDLARWDVAFLAGKTLPVAMLVEETKPVQLTGGGTTPDGLGLFVSHSEGVTRYYHSGQGLGFTAINMIYPERGIAFAVLSNTSVGSVVNMVADRITYLLISPTQDAVYARAVFSGLQSGLPDTTTWTADLKAYMTGKTLATYHGSLSPLGPVQSFYLRSSSVTDGLESRDYALSAGDRDLRMHLLLMPDGRLEDVTVTDAAQP